MCVTVCVEGERASDAHRARFVIEKQVKPEKEEYKVKSLPGSLSPHSLSLEGTQMKGPDCSSMICFTSSYTSSRESPSTTAGARGGGGGERRRIGEKEGSGCEDKGEGRIEQRRGGERKRGGEAWS